MVQSGRSENSQYTSARTYFISKDAFKSFRVAIVRLAVE